MTKVGKIDPGKGIQENYLSFASSICAQAAEDAVSYIRKLNSRLTEAKNQMEEVKNIRSKYDDLILNDPDNHYEIVKCMTKLFDYKDRGLQLTAKGKDGNVAINHIKGDILSLDTFFKGEWFYALHGGCLDPKTVMKAIINRTVGLSDISTFTDYIEYFDNEIIDINKYITEGCVTNI